MPKVDKDPNIDVHVGRRIRHRRWLLGMTQIDLGIAVGVAFQQIQKYEAGTNRVPASRLWDIAQAQQTNIGYYFEGLEFLEGQRSTDLVIDIGDVFQNKEALELIGMCRALPTFKREKLLALAKAISAANSAEDQTDRPARQSSS